MSMIRVGDIVAQCCCVVAEVSDIAEIKPFGNGGTYQNIDLLDHGKPIKLTLFGEKYIKAAKIAKVFVRSFYLHVLGKFNSNRNRNLMLFLWLFLIFLSPQVGKHYRFANVRADKVKPNFEHLHKNEHKLQLFGAHEFSVDEVVAGEVSASERASINAKNAANTPNDAYECPKIGCGRQMWKIRSGDFSCGECSGNYSTFKFREESQIYQEAAIPESVTPKTTTKPTPKASASAKKRSAQEKDDDEEEQKSAKRRLRRR